MKIVIWRQRNHAGGRGGGERGVTGGVPEGLKLSPSPSAASVGSLQPGLLPLVLREWEGAATETYNE